MKELLKNTNAVICGGSAGSMNCADIVYCPPELDGESLDKNFVRYLEGLGLTNLNIMPHYDARRDDILDGKKYFEEIILPDSCKNQMLVLNDGSFVIQENGTQIVYGESYIFENGQITKICEDNETVNLNEVIKENENART